MRTLPSLRRITQGAAAACVFGLAAAPLATAQDGSRAALQSFDRVDDVAWSDARNVPVFLSGDLRAASSAQPEAIAEAFLDEQTAMLRAAGPVDFAISRTIKDDQFGSSHVRVMQEVSGVPVFGAESVVHIGRQGQVYAFGGDVHPEASAVDTKAALTAQAALAVAKGWLPAGSVLAVDAVAMPEDGPMAESTAIAPTARLVIYPEADGTYRLAYHADVQVVSPDLARWQVFVDAKTGEVFHYFNAIHSITGLDTHAHAEHAASVNLEAAAPMMSAAAVQASTGSGSSLYRGSVSLDTYLSSNTYYLYDVTRGPSYIRTMAATNGGTGWPGNYITDTGNTFTSSAQRPAVDVHWGVAQVFDYYKNTHGRNSYNGNNASITSTINGTFSGSPNNAVWTGSQMAYGNGDGSQFGPLVDLDITAHELTHAVTQTTANLIYQNESGALNEAVSDIFAAMVDRTDWTVGEDSYTPGVSGDALRSLSNPPAGGSSQPDNYADRYTGTGDYGGVHINSGIFNKAAYLMAQGGTFRNVAVASMGRAKTERVWYRALVNYFTQSSGYTSARSGVLQATADLYGSGGAEYATVQNAFAAVGIGSASSGGGGGSTPPSGGTPTWRYEDINVQTPHNYQNNWNNTYTYTKNGAQRIALYFQQFEMENNYDFVYIKDSGNTTRATYTGTKSAFWAIVDGGQIKVNTVTDYSVTDYGWRITRAAYYSDRNLLVADEDPNPVLGFVPEAAMSDEVMLMGSKNVPAELALTGIYPNPTSGAATVAYALPQTADVELSAYDVLGRRVAVLASGSVEAGTHEASFDASALPAGLYVVRLRAGDQVLTERITVTR